MVVLPSPPPALEWAALLAVMGCVSHWRAGGKGMLGLEQFLGIPAWTLADMGVGWSGAGRAGPPWACCRGQGWRWEAVGSGYPRWAPRGPGQELGWVKAEVQAHRDPGGRLGVGLTVGKCCSSAAKEGDGRGLASGPLHLLSPTSGVISDKWHSFSEPEFPHL